MIGTKIIKIDGEITEKNGLDLEPQNWIDAVNFDPFFTPCTSLRFALENEIFFDLK